MPLPVATNELCDWALTRAAIWVFKCPADEARRGQSAADHGAVFWCLGSGDSFGAQRGSGH